MAKKWIQGVTKSIEKRGTAGVCTGSKMGGSSCPAGSKRYNLANLFHRFAQNRKASKKGYRLCTWT